jgi:restriction endonuclease S subunit
MKTEPGEYPLVVTAGFRRAASTYQLEGPAVCVPLVSSTGHGDAALHRVHYQEGKFALANLLVALLPKDSTILDAKFLYHLLTAKKDEYFVPLMLGTANVSLKVDDIAGVEIPVPPLEEQRRIVARIEELTAKIEEARGLRKQAVEDGELLLYSWARRQHDLLADEYRMIPLLSVCDFRGGSQPPKHSFVYERMNGYVRFLQIRDFTSDEYPAYIAQSPRNRLVNKNEILVGRYGASLGKILRGKEGAYNVAMCKAVQILENVDMDFLSYLLEYGEFQDRLRQISRSAQAGFNKGDLSELSVPIPPINEQRRIVACLDSLRSKVGALKRMQDETAKELDAMLPSILDKAFKGELV